MNKEYLQIKSKNEYMKEYRQKNKDKIKEYRLQNKDKMKKYQLERNTKYSDYHKQYRIRNREKNKKYQKQYRIINREKIKRYKKEYFEKNREKAYKLFNNWIKTEKGRLTKKKANFSRRRKLGFNILFDNILDESFDWHHTSKSNVVAIPTDLHDLYHSNSPNTHRDNLIPIIEQLYPGLLEGI
ncbi:MAG: hypothetical protein IMZ52_10115 [Actinobacteria bacterium]|nr:hypothetical protein [Actinomycetota bacterium]MBE3122579.1 hypothetical protein [Thermoplasmata archaeon]